MKAYAHIVSGILEGIYSTLEAAERVGFGFLYTVYGDDMQDCIEEAYKHIARCSEEHRVKEVQVEEYRGIFVGESCQWNEHCGEVVGFDREDDFVHIRYYPYSDDVPAYGSIYVHQYTG